MTPCAYRIPDTSGGDHACKHPAHAVWRHDIKGEWPLCRRHDLKAQAAVLTEGLRAFVGWHRAECAETLQDGPGRPEAASVAS